jgi:hypothetical protein
MMMNLPSLQDMTSPRLIQAARRIIFSAYLLPQANQKTISKQVSEAGLLNL